MDFKISCLLFIFDESGKILLIERAKSPNYGKWSPPGGKLDMDAGESPAQCAAREAFEETGIEFRDRDLRLFGYVSEKNYEGKGHWLMFLFECIPCIRELPPSISEGKFGFFSREEIDRIPIPPTDHKVVWPLFDKRKLGFWGIRADFSSDTLDLRIEAEPLLKDD